MLLSLLFDGDQVENGGQDEDGGALGQACDDPEYQSQVIDENGAQSHDEKVDEDNDEVDDSREFILWFDLSFDGLADEARAEGVFTHGRAVPSRA